MDLELRVRFSQQAAEAMNDAALLAVYLKDAREFPLGISYYLAQEMEARGLRSRKTAALTPKAERILSIVSQETSEPRCSSKDRSQGRWPTAG